MYRLLITMMIFEGNIEAMIAVSFINFFYPQLFFSEGTGVVASSET